MTSPVEAGVVITFGTSVTVAGAGMLYKRLLS